MDNLSKQIEQVLIDDVNEAIQDNLPVKDVEITNIENIQPTLNSLSRRVTKDLAEMILARAKYYCPVNTGRLRDSGHIVENADGSCDIIFDTDYALYQHEASWLNHKLPQSSHFLDRAINEITVMYGIR